MHRIPRLRILFLRSCDFCNDSDDDPHNFAVSPVARALAFFIKALYKTGSFKPLNKKNLYSFFSKKEKELSAYLNANPVNYVQEEDVLRLISFLKTL